MSQIGSNDQEINRAISRIDQNFTYMFTILAAFLAAQLALKSFYSALDRTPADLLVLSILGLWFPANHAIFSIDLVTAGQWRRKVLFPAVAELAMASAAGTQDERLRRAAAAANTIDWERFRQEKLFEHAPVFGVMNLLWFVKATLLYVPSAAALTRFIFIVSKPGHPVIALDIALLIVLAAAALIVLIANVRQGNLPAIYRAEKRARAAPSPPEPDSDPAA